MSAREAVVKFDPPNLVDWPHVHAALSRAAWDWLQSSSCLLVRHRLQERISLTNAAWKGALADGLTPEAVDTIVRLGGARDLVEKHAIVWLDRRIKSMTPDERMELLGA